MEMCSKSWKGVGCVSAALPGRDVCAVHAKKPDYAPPTGELIELDLDPNAANVIRACFDDAAKCHECDGTGDCECTCGDRHDCRTCEGTGKVDACRFCGMADEFATDGVKRRHLEDCDARTVFAAHVASNTLTADEKKLYDRLLNEIGPDSADDPDDCAMEAPTNP